ncbi:VOC family protein [Aquimarina addita]
MTIKRTGTILYVQNYLECIKFYQEIVGLTILFQNNQLTCFDLHGTYLMVEIEDRNTYKNLPPEHKRVFSCIRINTDDVKGHAEQLRLKNIEVDYQENDWGTVAKFYDPDGNLIAYKDEETFLAQISNYKLHE